MQWRKHIAGKSCWCNVIGVPMWSKELLVYCQAIGDSDLPQEQEYLLIHQDDEGDFNDCELHQIPKTLF